MRKPTALLLALFGLPVAFAASGGPDSAGWEWLDSDEADGPPHQALDIDDEGQVVSFDSTGARVVEPGFEVDFYGSSYDRMTLLEDGAALFSYATTTPHCPPSTSWTGVAPYWSTLSGGTVTTATLGRYPNRLFVVDWNGFSPGTGSGRAQVWFQEARPDVVIALDDVDFGSSAYDGGAGAVIGVSAGAYGLEWSCSGGLSSGTSAWFGDPGEWPGAPEVDLYDVEVGWYGTKTYSYLGQTQANGDVNADGYSDLLIGAPDQDTAILVYGGPVPGSGSASGAAATFSGGSADDLGASLAIGDLDGDGLGDLAIGESGNDDTASDAGAVLLWSSTSFSGAIASSTADASLRGPSSSTKANAGTDVALPGDVDGDGYGDVLVGANAEDSAGTNAGAVFVWSGSASWSKTTNLNTKPSFRGETGGDRLGSLGAVGGGDPDGDGIADIVLGASLNDDGATDAGKAYFIAGGSTFSGAADVSSAADVAFQGTSSSDYVGAAVALGDLDGDGDGDIVIGAPRNSPAGVSKAGSVYIFKDVATLSGTKGTNVADLQIRGSESNANVGTTLAVGDLDRDGADDLAVGGPGSASSYGRVWVWTTLPSSSPAAVADADNILTGGYAAGAAGKSLGILEDHQGDGYGDVAVGVYFASVASTTLSGLLAVWPFLPSFLDGDGDGLVAVEADGPDCDDGDAGSFPGNDEDSGLDSGGADDDDCDGWVDGAYSWRLDEDLWEYDRTETLADATDKSFGFDTASSSGASVESMYSGSRLTLSAGGGTVTASADVYGSAASGTYAAKIPAGSGSNAVLLTFDEDVDAVGLQILDPDGRFEFRAFLEDGSDLLASGGAIAVDMSGDNLPEGRFIGFTFSESVRYLRIEGEATDGFGLDDVQIHWAESSDRDGDTWTGLTGDCDDDDAAVNPGQTEDLSNGIDDDCDGVVDGGSATATTDAATFDADSGVSLQTIDFEDLSAGDVVTAQYDDLGLNVDSTLEVSASVDGAAPNGSLGAEATSTTVTLAFDELQPAVAFTLLDAKGTFHVVGYAGGVELYDEALSLSEEGSSSFHGFLFDYGVDTLEIQGPGDTFGIDDVIFAELGLDDSDGDGFTEAEDDCDDTDPAINPDAEEIWYDGVDQNCDGASDDDADADGYDLGEDCDDEDSTVSPSATETWYDGVDQDCDGGSDFDADLDGSLSEEYGGTDCDDGDDSVNPDAAETWYDGVDDNCDSSDDNDSDGDGYAADGFAAGSLGSDDCDDADASTWPSASDAWYDGVDSDCGGDSDFDADLDGYESEDYGGDDCNDGRADANPAGTEVYYDGVDQDCDGASDFDADGDGFDIESRGGTDCDDRDPNISPAATESDNDDGIDEDCDGTDEWDDDGDGHRAEDKGGDDCDDADPAISPSAEETCYDGQDQDCDSTNEYDCDEDGHESDSYGGDDCDDADPTVNPEAAEWAYDGTDSDCDGADDYDQDADGYASAWYGGDDCDDDDSAVNPGQTEIWYDGTDQDCDGNDADQDLDGSESPADCDDGDAGRSPETLEIPYDGIDQDCSGADAEDVDGDGYAPTAAGGLDCDDADAAVNPVATETWYDGIDQDCDGLSDYDADLDGHDTTEAAGDDCDDTDPRVYLGATERWYDGLDWDCSGGDDFDQDGDGHKLKARGGDDCDDTDAAVSPSTAVDQCGNGDEDCDGKVDEDEDCAEADPDTGGEDTGGDTGGDSGSDSGGDSEDSDPPQDSEDSDQGQVIDTGPGDLQDPQAVVLNEGCGRSSAAGILLVGLSLALGGRRRRSPMGPA